MVFLQVDDDTDTFSGDAHITVFGCSMMKGQHRCAFPHEPIHRMHRHDPAMRLLAARLQPKVTLYGVFLGCSVTLPPGERSGVNISKHAKCDCSACM